MGMDVFGRTPTSKQGEYFRASIWDWQPLYLAMGRTAHDLLGDELLNAMAFNEGEGPADQATCTQIADRLEHALNHDRSAFAVESDFSVDGLGRLLTSDEARQLGPERTGSPYQVERGFVLDWNDFLRHCGGFAVW